MQHNEASELAGQTVTVHAPGMRKHLGDTTEDHTFHVEDWWDRLGSGSWMTAAGNPAAINYAVRVGLFDLPIDDNVLYGKDERGLGHLVHISEVKA